jgi:hypothetical protein
MICRRTLKIVSLFAVQALVLCAGATSAECQKSLVGATDSTAVRQIGPGVYHHLRRDSRGPWVINVVEIDRRNPYLHFETAKAGHRLQGLEKTSAMALAADAERHRVVAAINGDFFDPNGVVINLQIRRGELWRGPTQHSAFAVGAGGAPLIELFTAFYRLRTADSQWFDLSGFNRPRQADEAILYTLRFGPATGANAFGSEAVVQLLSPLVVNDTLKAVVRERRVNAGNSPLSPSMVAVSAHGAKQTWLNEKINAGDTLLLVCGLRPDVGRIVEAVGGLPRIVRDGKVSVETKREGGENFANVRHPRTAIGFSADSSKIFLVTVDGRQSESDGMTLYELADLMISLGCAQALNLDGGGSTTMVVRGKVVNKPSDAAGERPVANALMLISKAPTGAASRLSIEPRLAICPIGESVDFSVAATDSFFNLIALGDDQFVWRLSDKKAFAKIDGKGKFVAQSRPLDSRTAEDSAFVIVSRPGATARDTAKVIITTWREIKIEPDSLSLVVGSGRALQATLVDSRGRLYKKPPARLSWQVEGKIGTISATGIFSATAVGEGFVRVGFNNVEKKIPVVVKQK